MADKQWFLTKLLGSLLGIISLVSITIGAANVVVNMQSDIDRVEADVISHKLTDEKRWDRSDDKINKLDNDVDSLKIQNERTTVQYVEIMRRIDEINAKIDRFEVVQ